MGVPHPCPLRRSGAGSSTGWNRTAPSSTSPRPSGSKADSTRGRCAAPSRPSWRGTRRCGRLSRPRRAKPCRLPAPGQVPLSVVDFAAHPERDCTAEWQQVLTAEVQHPFDLTRDLTALELPTDRPRPAVQTSRGTRRTRILPPSLRTKLDAPSRTRGERGREEHRGKRSPVRGGTRIGCTSPLAHPPEVRPALGAPAGRPRGCVPALDDPQPHSLRRALDTRLGWA